MFSINIEENLQLVLLERRHAAELFKLTDDSRHYLRDWLPWIDFTKTVADSDKFIQLALQQFANNDGFQLGIYSKGQLAGMIGLHGINWTNKSTSIGYWLGESFQGKGIMVKSCRAVTDYCFNELQLNRMEIRAAVGNRKSGAIPEKLGFIKEGTVRQAEWLYDQFVDHHVYGMLREDWNKN